jgi:hypothetical protein
MKEFRNNRPNLVDIKFGFCLLRLMEDKETNVLKVETFEEIVPPSEMIVEPLPIIERHSLGLELLELHLPSTIESTAELSNEEIVSQHSTLETETIEKEKDMVKQVTDPIVITCHPASTSPKQNEDQEQKRPPLYFTRKAMILFLTGFIVIVAVIVSVLVVVYRVDQTSPQQSSSTTSGKTAIVGIQTPNPVPTTTATKLDNTFTINSPNRLASLSFNSQTCYMVLKQGIEERWSTPPNSFYNCDLHLQLDGNLVMYFGNGVVWRAVTDGRVMNNSVLTVTNDGLLQLFNQQTNEIYWSAS